MQDILEGLKPATLDNDRNQSYQLQYALNRSLKVTSRIQGHQKIQTEEEEYKQCITRYQAFERGLPHKQSRHTAPV